MKKFIQILVIVLTFLFTACGEVTDGKFEGEIAGYKGKSEQNNNGGNTGIPNGGLAPPSDSSPSMVFINGGTFTMGSPSWEIGRYDDEIQHQVTLSAFYIGQFEVTQTEYEAVMGSNPSYFKGAPLPVENVTWYEAVEYCNKLSIYEGRTPAYIINGTTVTWNKSANGYRLPTEAEWEYACRAGTTGPYSTGDNITNRQANYSSSETMNVRSFTPNAWGLYNMHGNVWEWCWDWYGDYVGGSQTNPSGAASGSSRVLRGGSWNGRRARFLRSAYRNNFGTPTFRYYDIGFRVVRS